MRILTGVDEVRAAVGDHLGYSDYRIVTQQEVSEFGALTGDDQWIHVDVALAKEGPFGGTIAHGLLTLSLGPRLVRSIYQIKGMKMGVNYGYNKIRFPAPVPVGSRIRIGATLQDVQDVPGGLQVQLDFVWEIEGGAKPACVAEMLLRYSA
jgi:acyl dehydratase